MPVFWFLAVLCAGIADIDVIGFYIGIPYGSFWGHRGMTHSLVFAAAIAGAVAFAWQGIPREKAGLAVLLFLITASHGMLDALTNGGLGVAFFAPFSVHRYFFPWRPIRVSPIGLPGLFSARAVHVLATEIPWIWTPALVLVGAVSVLRAWQKTRTARLKG
jgi:inner membrane protein